jgi:hypothetical protein
MDSGSDTDLLIVAAPGAPAPLVGAAVRRACERGLCPRVIVPLIVPRQLPGEAIEDIAAPEALALEHAALCALGATRGHVEIVPSRSLGEAVASVEHVQPTLVVGHAGWMLRHALAHRGAPLSVLWPRGRDRLDPPPALVEAALDALMSPEAASA